VKRRAAVAGRPSRRLRRGARAAGGGGATEQLAGARAGAAVEAGAATAATVESGAAVACGMGGRGAGERRGGQASSRPGRVRDGERWSGERRAE
jgi:hypothetical protein